MSSVQAFFYHVVRFVVNPSFRSKVKCILLKSGMSDARGSCLDSDVVLSDTTRVSNDTQPV